jgi:hypothetical protein
MKLYVPLLDIPRVDGRGRCLVSAVLISAPSRGIEFSACRTCTASLPAASSSSAEYVVNVFLTSSRRFLRASESACCAVNHGFVPLQSSVFARK